MSDPIAFNLLCAKCRELFDKASRFKVGHTFYQDHQSLEASRLEAERGCHLCASFIGAFTQSDHERLKEYPELSQKLARMCIYLRNEPRQQLRLRSSLPLTHDEESTAFDYMRSMVNAKTMVYNFAELELVYKEGPFIPHFSNLIVTVLMIEADALPTRQILACGTGEEECSSLIRYWMDQCREHHGACTSESRRLWGDFRPSRLLEVRQSDDVLSLVLRDSDVLPKDITYLTLSHCWGGNLPFTLCEGTKAELMSGVAISILPQTFQDAANLTFQLGVKYIWIDALCIIQGSMQDWENEGAQMCEVYSYAAMNIMATTSSDGSSGLFRTRNPLAVTACRIKAEWEGFRPGELVCYDPDRFASRIARGILNTRAWVVQERLLSAGNVHFTEDEIFWECRTLIASESFPQGIPGGNEYYKSWDQWRYRARNPKNIPLWHWNEMIDKFTNCRLTQKSDKLIALSGLAKDLSLQSILDSEYEHLGVYLAGLWRSKLCEQLLWKTSMNLSTARSPDYRAPSWSWASINGPVNGNFGSDIKTLMVFARVEEATTITGLDAFGIVTGGSMLITGFLSETILLGSFIPARPPFEDQADTEMKFYGTLQFGSSPALPLGPTPPPDSPLPGGPTRTTGSWGRCGPFAITWDDLKNESLHPLPVYFMLLRQCEMFTGQIECTYHDYEGLLLRPTGNKHGQYRRVGTLKFWNLENLSGFFSEVSKATLKEHAYVAVAEPWGDEGLRPYTVEII